MRPLLFAISAIGILSLSIAGVFAQALAFSENSTFFRKGFYCLQFAVNKIISNKVILNSKIYSLT